jgi:hypothetical protein
MEQILNIVIDNGPVWQVNAGETGLGPSPQLQTPETIAGKLLDLSLESLLKIRFGKDVSVSFEGVSYRFAPLRRMAVSNSRDRNDERRTPTA